jgi:transcriptional regulator with XRE-family HTH domain
MTLASELDPSASVLAFYATDLRRYRERHGVSQRSLARKALMAPSLLNKIEAGTRLPTKDLSVLADQMFGTGDHFQRLWPLVIRYAYPAWYRPYLELEVAATRIKSFQVQLVHGLLQTEEYARALMSSRRLDAEEANEKVAARLERQSILRRPDRPELWVIMDELVLHRHVGGREVMRHQFESLVTAAEEPRTVLQIVPFDAGSHAGIDGPFSSLALDEGPGVVVVDGFLQGHILGDPEQVKAAERAYDLLTAVSLSPQRSVDLIAKAIKDLR